MNDPIIHIPTRSEIQNLKVGDLALDCFGRMSEVVSIHAQKDDIHGKAFVCYYTALDSGATISHSEKQGKLTRTLPLCHQYTSRELDEIEEAYR